MAPVRKPKYTEIRDDLARRIQRREFAAGQALPAQARLAEHYGVTLMTLRQALRELQDDGLIAQEAGRGTFVSPAPPVLELGSLRSLAEEMRAQGVPLTTTVLGQGARGLVKPAAAALGRPRGERGLRLERLRKLGPRVAVHQVSWIPAPWAGELAGIDFTRRALYQTLREQCSIVVAAADERVRASALPAAVAGLTGNRPGRPVLVTERTSFDREQRPVVYDRATILDDSVQIALRRTRHDVQLAWTGPAAAAGVRD